MQALPADGVPAAQVLEEIAKLRATDLPTHGGRLFAYVYDPVRVLPQGSLGERAGATRCARRSRATGHVATPPRVAIGAVWGVPVRADVGDAWLHGLVTETAVTRARAPLPRYRLVRPLGVERAPVLLDREQQAVVAHQAGPLLVLGGPGTGKTTTLVEAVAARVAEGVAPDHILVLTFGRRAAAALRDRIEARIGRGSSATPAGPRCPSPSYGPSPRTRSACSASPPPNAASPHRGS